ncbi:hypothetical protein PEC18_19825 [Paucibacter sp. O1-1]|nr:hypothetical protein [Paucibacter sp. O1-1]MDA3828016.1 hypothetical protein [Paucibacter sp. O1-1]
MGVKSVKEWQAHFFGWYGAAQMCKINCDPAGFQKRHFTAGISPGEDMQTGRSLITKLFGTAFWNERMPNGGGIEFIYIFSNRGNDSRC